MTGYPWKVGQEIEPLVIGSVDAGRIKTVAAILQDPTPIHLDPAATRARGMVRRWPLRARST
jgi:acyl dehydratase